MNIHFIVTNFRHRNTGLGGCVRSTIAIAEALSREHNVRLLCVGDYAPQMLHSSDIDWTFIRSSWYNYLLRGQHILLSATPINSDDLVIGVASHSLIPLRHLSATSKCRLIGIKPGGGRSKSQAIPTAWQIHFSKSDYDHALTTVAQLGGGAAWIPNRIAPFHVNQEWSHDFRRTFNLDRSILTIGHVASMRKSKFYAHAATLQAAAFLRSEGIAARAILLGTEYSDTIRRKLDNLKGDNDIVCVNPRFTGDGKQLVFLSDMMVGMGRSFMEAAVAGSVALACSSACGLPVVPDPTTFLPLLHENFTDRSTIQITERQIKQHLRALATDESERAKVRTFLSEMSSEYFAVTACIRKYADFLSKVLNSPSGQAPSDWPHGPKLALASLASDALHGRYDRLLTLVPSRALA